MMSDFFFREVERARAGESNYKFRFFPWFNFPGYRLPVDGAFNLTPEEQSMMDKYGLEAGQMKWYRRKQTEFKTHALFLREYPSMPEEAFLSSGSSFFDPDVLKYYHDNIAPVVKEGGLAHDGQFI